MLNFDTVSGSAVAGKAETLLSRPECGESAKLLELERDECSYENSSERFVLKERSFTRQYSQIYAVRLMAMRKHLATAVRRKWGNSVTITKLVDLKPGVRCCIIGTLFKKMVLKPSILKEVCDEHDTVPQPPRGKLIDDEDELILEDESQRVVLTGNLSVHQAVTGTIAAVVGEETASGKFEVSEYVFRGLSYQAPATVDTALSAGQDRYVAIVSGFGFGQDNQDQFSLEMFADLITGHLGSDQDQEGCSKVVRLIIAGNSLSQSTQSKEAETKAKYLTKNTKAGSVEAIKQLDDFLVQLASCIPVDIMPGEFDPGNFVMPQQPLHRCMFPQASSYSTLQSVTNPYECSIGGIRFLGTSGQNVNDIFRFASMDDGMTIMENMMNWGHIAPTAPDTLGCYPYYDKDPFIVEKCPHVFFVGNQSHFKAKVISGESDQKVLLVMVPKFLESKTCVLVNLRTMECLSMSFGASLNSEEQVAQSKEEPMEE